MPGRSINVVVAHRLGIEVAKERLRKLGDGKKSEYAYIEHGSFSWDSSSHRFEFDVTKLHILPAPPSLDRDAVVFNPPVHITVGIAADRVTVASSPIPGWWGVVAAAVWRAE